MYESRFDSRDWKRRGKWWVSWTGMTGTKSRKLCKLNAVVASGSSCHGIYYSEKPLNVYFPERRISGYCCYWIGDVRKVESCFTYMRNIYIYILIRFSSWSYDSNIAIPIYRWVNWGCLKNHLLSTHYESWYCDSEILNCYNSCLAIPTVGNWLEWFAVGSVCAQFL